MKKIPSIIICVLIAAFGASAIARASVGVGIGSGKITLNEMLKPGSIYELPTVPVLNTGDETSNYGVSVEYNEVQPQLKPKAEWFHFAPETFTLAPGKSQVVKIDVSVPVNAVPGDYFAYLEAHPIKADVAGVTSVGVAAASKLYFTIAPANVFAGVYYRVLSLLVRGAPWTYLVLGLVALIILIKIFLRFFKFNIAINVKKG